MKFLMNSLVALALLVAFPATAGQVNISKLRLDLTNGKHSEFLVLKNESETEKQAFEVSIQKWEQESNVVLPLDKKNIAPNNILTDTNDLAVFPKTVVIGPKQEKVIRVITKDVAKAQSNYSYRMSINQLETHTADSNANTLNWLFNVSLPVFVANKAITKVSEMNLEYKVDYKAGSITITNNSSSHLQIKEVVTDVGRQGMNFYILSKMTQKISIPPNSKEVSLVTDKGELSLK